jgi:hypothetical protein
MSNEIEIRKQKNQFVIGRIPSWIVRWGNVVILAICSLLLYLSFSLKFPVIVNCQVDISGDGVYVVVPELKQDLLKEGMEINLRMDDYPYMDYGILQARISSLSDIKHAGNSILIPVLLLDEFNTIKRNDLIPGMKGSGDIIVDKTPVIYRILRTKN